MGFKTFAVGEVFTATDVMTYLMRQVVIGCTSSTRPATPQTGMPIYETDTHKLRIFDGGWVDIAKTDVANTFTAKQTISAGGLDIAGSPSGYTDELRFTGTAGGGDHAVTTIDTGTVTMLFDHRGGSNTGRWVWRNGTSAANTRLTLTAAGLLQPTGGIDVTGSPTGYGGGEIRFPGAAAFSTLDTGATEMRFDHRAASNTGAFRFSNGTNGASTRLLIGATGNLQTQGDDHYLGRAGLGGTGSRLHVVAPGSYVQLICEDQASARVTAYFDAANYLFRDVASASVAQIDAASGLGSQDTALWLAWVSNSGTPRYKRVRAGETGGLDGTSRAYLYVVDS